MSTKTDDNTTKLNLKISGSGYELQLSELYQNATLASGKIECQISDISTLIRDALPDIDYFFAQIKQQGLFSLKADIAANANSTDFSNIIVDAELIKGSGSIRLSRNDNTASSFNVQFSEINLGGLFDLGDTINANQMHAQQLQLVFGQKKIYGELGIGHISLASNEAIKNFKLVIDLDSGKLNIKDCTFDIASGGSLQLNGVVTQNYVRSIFEGKIALSHQDLNTILRILDLQKQTVDRQTPFTLSGDLQCTTIDCLLRDLVLNTDNLGVTGTIGAKFIGSQPRINLSLNTSNVDFDKMQYPILTPIITFIEDLFQDAQSKDYLNKFTPIRTIPYIANADVTFANLTIGDRNFDSVRLVTTLAPAKVTINSFSINNRDNYAMGNASLVTDKLQPQFTLNITDGVLPINFLDPSYLLDLRSILLNKAILNKIALQFNGQLSRLYQNDLMFKNVVFDISNNSTLFNINVVKAQFDSGNVEIAGSVLLDPYTWNLVYALNSINLSELSQTLPDGFQKFNGLMSANGTISTSGDSVEKLLYNLYTKSSLIVKDSTINEFGLDQFVEKVNADGYNMQQLDGDLTTALSTGTTGIPEFSSDFELNNGIIQLSNATLKTKYTSANVLAAINIYDTQLNVSSIFSFYINQPITANTRVSVYKKDIKRLIELPINVTGTILALQKTADSNVIIDALHSTAQSPQKVKQNNNVK